MQSKVDELIKSKNLIFISIQLYITSDLYLAVIDTKPFFTHRIIIIQYQRPLRQGKKTNF